MNDREKRDLIAQWAFDTRAILGRFHLWLDDVEVEWLRGRPEAEFTWDISFLPGHLERLFAMTGAVTALGTQLFGRFGEGAGRDRLGLNEVKKDADAISAYAMSESLWYLTRQLPENHALMVCLGEGLMPKAGETPEMGSNPLLGFGRVYARPEVAKWLDHKVQRLLNDPDFGWERFYQALKSAGITVWGAAIDTLENTSRFAKGAETGPMTILHVFDQPLSITRPYEGYMGNLFVPKEVVETAAAASVLIDFRTPRRLVLEAIERTYPGVQPENVHVWTLRGQSRAHRLRALWAEWDALGVHRVEPGWILPSGLPAFTDSGTYAPTFLVGTWQEGGQTHVFLTDGYAASAEAMQAASLAPMLGLTESLSVFTSRFELPQEREREVMHLRPGAADFGARLEAIVGAPLTPARETHYRAMIDEAAEAGLPLHKAQIGVDDFFPEKSWKMLSVSGYMGPDPYSGSPGIEDGGGVRNRASVRLATPRGDKRIAFVLRLMQPFAESQLVFKPLLNRFLAGEDYQNRPVRISDSGRIRNELQTLCTEALEFVGGTSIRLHPRRIGEEIVPSVQLPLLLEVLRWYKRHHPRWFAWLELCEGCDVDGR